jgi:hypothetical protein
MILNQTLRLSCLIVGVVGGLTLCFAYLIPGKHRNVPRSTRRLFFLLGLFGTSWGIFGLIASYNSSHQIRWATYIMEHCRILSGGIALGLFLALCVTGGFTSLSRKRTASETGA